MVPFYEPFKPSRFVCKPTGALIITMGGEIEVLSQECSAPIATFPKFSGVGRTSSLLDEELLLLGDDDLGTRKRYISIQKPREGLLAMKYTIEDFSLPESPHQHLSLVSKNDLTVLGGKFKSRGKLSKFTWTEFSLKWENGSMFNYDFINNACSVKLGVDMHIIFGGERKSEDQQTNGRHVVKINTTDEIAYELNPLTYGRSSHDCQLLNDKIVLVAGGFALNGENQSEILQDELYNITSQEVIKVLDRNQSLGRAQHAMVKIKERILALGGMDSNNNTPSQIAEFNTTTNTWTELANGLHSKNTSDLIAIPLPVASLDCVPDCSCGIANKSVRIFNGTEVGNV